MKWKQILFTITISVVTTLAVIWGYGTFFAKSDAYAGQQNGVVPAGETFPKRSLTRTLSARELAGRLDGN